MKKSGAFVAGSRHRTPARWGTGGAIPFSLWTATGQRTARQWWWPTWQDSGICTAAVPSDSRPAPSTTTSCPRTTPPSSETPTSSSSMLSRSSRHTSASRSAYPSSSPFAQHYLSSFLGLHARTCIPNYAEQDERVHGGMFGSTCQVCMTSNMLGTRERSGRHEEPRGSWCSDTLVDFLGEPYPASIQAARREGRLGCMSEAELATELRSQPGMLPNALIQAGPTLTAAAWQSQVCTLPTPLMPMPL